MNDMILAITLLWAFVFIYAVAATIDFGAGFWSMIYLNRHKMRATRIANQYLSPSWEITNVFIVLIVVALFSFFPGATYTLGTVLLIPGSIIILLLTIRSSFLVFSHATKEYKNILTIISGVTGFLIPGLLILVLPITQGGFIYTLNNVQNLDLAALFLSPHIYAFIAFAIANTLFLSSLLLADYSHTANDPEAYQIYRRDALLLGPITLMTAILIILTMKGDALWLYQRMLTHTVALSLSVLFFILGYLSLTMKVKGNHMPGRPRYAMFGIVIQYLFASYAYGRSHLPYIVYPTVTIKNGFTHPSMFHALFTSYMVGFIILVPGFIYFWRLFMNKKFLKEHSE